MNFFDSKSFVRVIVTCYSETAVNGGPIWKTQHTFFKLLKTNRNYLSATYTILILDIRF